MYFPLLAKEDDPRALFADVDFCAEEMLDGRRLLVSKHGSVVRAYSRNRTPYVLPLSMVRLADSFQGDFVVEGELVGESFIAFDILEACGVNVCREVLVLRRRLLALISPFPLAALATGEEAKTRLYERVREACGAGILFKRLDVTYDSGHDVFGVRFNNYRAFHLDDASIEKRGIGSGRDGTPSRPELLCPAENIGLAVA